MNKNQVRAAKRSYVTVTREWDEDDQEYVRVRERTYENIPDGAPHAPNKNEGKELRRIMARTGLTEAEVRDRYQYRKQLSKAQKVPKKDVKARDKLHFKREARYQAQKLNLPVYHPDVQKATQLAIDAIRWRRGRW
jgi:hypothetical protein